MYRAEENPFGIAGQAIAQGAPYLSNPYDSAGKNALYTVGAGLLAGLLGGVARNQTESDNLSLMKDWSTAVKDPTAREAISAKNSRLASAINALQLEEQQREAELAQKQQELYMSKQADRGYFMGPKGEMVRAFDPIRDAVEKAERVKRGEVLAENSALETLSGGADGAINPASPIGKSVLEREESLRKEFYSLGPVKDFEKSEIGFRSLVKAIKDPSATSDLELVRGAIQAIEPGMAVREGEQAAVASSQSIPDEWKGALNKALNGGTGLSEDVRQGILRIAARRYSEYRDAFNQKHGAYAGLASGSRIDPQRVLLRDLAEDVGTIYPDYDKSLQAAQQAAGQPTPPPVMTFEEFRKQKQAQRNNGLF